MSTRTATAKIGKKRYVLTAMTTDEDRRAKKCMDEERLHPEADFFSDETLEELLKIVYASISRAQAVPPFEEIDKIITASEVSKAFVKILDAFPPPPYICPRCAAGLCSCCGKKISYN
jgi:hypothetical protein